MNKKIIIIIGLITATLVSAIIYFGFKKALPTDTADSRLQIATQDDLEQDVQSNAVESRTASITGQVYYANNKPATGTIIFGNNKTKLTNGSYTFDNILIGYYNIQFIDNSGNSIILDKKSANILSNATINFTVMY